MNEVTILGVDPGTSVMGYSLLRTELQNTEILTCDVIKMTKLTGQMQKLKFIFDTTEALIKQYQPSILAIEAPFFGKNPQSMLKLGRAQGVVITACLHHNIEVYEYSPRKIKQAITGNGNATKEQVAAMLQQIYKELEIPKFLDATDALAVAVCHHLQTKINFGNNKFTGWESFIAKNKDRIV
jgi:crossover junction endodeoxyribonuclease RuvC